VGDIAPSGVASERGLIGRTRGSRSRPASAGRRAALLAALVIGGAVPQGASFWTASSGVCAARPELADLVAAATGARPFEARVTGGFNWAPALAAQDQGRSPRLVASARRLALLADSPSWRARSAAGIADLVLGRTDAAIRTIESALEAADPDSRGTVLSDLSAALLVRSAERDDARDAARALDLADRVIQSTPGREEARFNRALALEYLGVWSAARAAWEDYQEVDWRSPWSLEAGRRARGLSTRQDDVLPVSEGTRQLARALVAGEGDGLRRVVRRGPQAAREMIDNDLLPDSADAWLRGDRGTAQQLVERAALVAQAIAAHTGDRLWVDEVAEVQAAWARGASAADTTAGALSAFQRAREEIDRHRFAVARPLLSQATASLGPSATALRAHLAFWGTFVDWYVASPEQLLPEIASLEELAGTRSYHYLEGRLRLVHGGVLLKLARYTDGTTQYEQSVAAFERAGEHEYLAAAHVLLGACLAEQGDRRAAWIHQRAALRRLDVLEGFRRRHTVLTHAATLAQDDGLPGTALHFQTALIADAARWSEPGAMVEALLQRARILSQTRRHDQALESITEAERWLGQVKDRAFQEAEIPLVLRAQGLVLTAVDPPRAVRLLAEVVERLRASGSLFSLAQAHLDLARARLASGDPSGAAADLDAGIALLEDQRPAVRDEQRRISRVNAVWDLYVEMIRLTATTGGQPDLALAYAERSRARALLDALAGDRPGSSDSPGRAGSVLRERDRVIFYAQLPEQLYIWVIAPAGITFRAVDAPRRVMNRLVQTIHEQPRLLDHVAVLERLYALTIAPVEDLLPEHGAIVIVPDGPLGAAPFAAGRTARRGAPPPRGRPLPGRAARDRDGAKPDALSQGVGRASPRSAGRRSVCPRDGRSRSRRKRARQAAPSSRGRTRSRNDRVPLPARRQRGGRRRDEGSVRRGPSPRRRRALRRTRRRQRAVPVAVVPRVCAVAPDGRGWAPARRGAVPTAVGSLTPRRVVGLWNRGRCVRQWRRRDEPGAPAARRRRPAGGGHPVGRRRRGGEHAEHPDAPIDRVGDAGDRGLEERPGVDAGQPGSAVRGSEVLGWIRRGRGARRSERPEGRSLTWQTCECAFVACVCSSNTRGPESTWRSSRTTGTRRSLASARQRV
jgi:tetratricopeptide (TPR) repeat protein